MSFLYAPKQGNPRGNEYSLLSLHAGILDHLAPALLLAVVPSLDQGQEPEASRLQPRARSLLISSPNTPSADWFIPAG